MELVYIVSTGGFFPEMSVYQCLVSVNTLMYIACTCLSSFETVGLHMDILLITYDVFDTVRLTEINYILGMRTRASNVQLDSLVKKNLPGL